MNPLSPAAIRARAGNSCECRNECGQPHPHGQCRCGGAFSKMHGTALTVIGQRQYCRKCSARMKA